MTTFNATAFADIDDEELTEEQFIQKRDQVCEAFALAEGTYRVGQMERLDYGLSILLIVASTVAFLLYAFLVL